jgi:hypothetical protein
LVESIYLSSPVNNESLAPKNKKSKKIQAAQSLIQKRSVYSQIQRTAIIDLIKTLPGREPLQIILFFLWWIIGAHKTQIVQQAFQSANWLLKFFPPNMTHILQPMDLKVNSVVKSSSVGLAPLMTQSNPAGLFATYRGPSSPFQFRRDHFKNDKMTKMENSKK